MPNRICISDDCTRPGLVKLSGRCSRCHYYWQRAECQRFAYVCAMCGNEYSTHRKYRGPVPLCGKPCATGWRNMKSAERDRKRRKAVVVYDGPRQLGQAPVTVIKSKGRWVNGKCRVCDTWFTSEHSDITCSKTCQTMHKREVRRDLEQRRRARKRNAFVANVYRLRVFEADGYRCHICHTHEPMNCRTACFQCNATKSDRGGGEQFALAI